MAVGNYHPLSCRSDPYLCLPYRLGLRQRSIFPVRLDIARIAHKTVDNFVIYCLRGLPFIAVMAFCYDFDDAVKCI